MSEHSPSHTITVVPGTTKDGTVTLVVADLLDADRKSERITVRDRGHVRGVFRDALTQYCGGDDLVILDVIRTDYDLALVSYEIFTKPFEGSV